MAHLSITGAVEGMLASAKRGQLKRLSFDFAFYGAQSVTLWMSTGEGFRVHSVMHNLAELIEVGVLHVEKVLQPAEHETARDVPWSFKNGCTAVRLVLEQSGSTAESGILLRSIGEGNELIVLPGAVAGSLYISGVELPPHEAAPEYPIRRYGQQTA